MNDEPSALLPLTTAQRGLWVGHKIGATDATMNIAEAVEICGPVQPEIFMRALWQVAAEVDAVRAGIIERDGRPFQFIRAHYHGDFPYIDYSEESDPRKLIDRWMLDELKKPVDLAKDPLWVNALFKASDNRYFWYQRAHHVIYDGYSGGMIARRQAELYTAFAEGREAPPCEFGSLQTLVEAEAAYRDSDRCRRDREFWKAQLADLPEAVSLARGGHRNGMGGLRRGSGYLSSDTAARLAALGRESSTSLPQVLIALVAAYYQRVTGAADLVIGMPVSGRINAALRSAPGMVANAVTLRLRFTPQMTAIELFEQVARVVRQALRHQQYRYEDLRRDLGLVGQAQHIAWLGVNIEPFDYQLSFAGARATPHNVSNGSAEDLTVFVYDRGDGGSLRFDFDANPALYSEAELDEHCRRLTRLVEAVLADPAQSLRQIDMLGEQERERLLQRWNETAQAVPPESLPALVARQARLSPLAPALVCDGRLLSYRELHRRSVRQARQLLADGIRPGDIVAVALPRSEVLPIVLLGILRCGAAYLPIDPLAPLERTAMMLDDAAPTAMIASPELAVRHARGGLLMLGPEEADASLEDMPDEPDFTTPEATAYVLYTSGSTGRPKGVEVTHRNLANFLHGMRMQLAPTPTDRFLAVTTIGFDIAVLELFLPLTAGASVVIAGSDSVRHPPTLARLIQHSGITRMQATPSLWRVLLACPALRLDGVHALVGGEALDTELAARLQRQAARLTQFYGPTETTVWSTAHELTEPGSTPPPIGRPIANTRLYVLDDERQLVPTGAVGELYIGGEGVAKGYLNHPQLSVERFLPDPFVEGEQRMYRTGDLVYWNDDATLQFVGRADQQVKIRGHRVELGEIESRLVRHASVAEAAVTAQRDGEGGTGLCAYLVAAPGAQIVLDALRGYLAGYLPDYMMPARFMLLDAMPLTPSGKLDRKALPQPERSERAAYVAPVGALEQKLAALWQQIFAVERVGRHENFFELGGDSLTAAAMMARFPEHFGMELPLGSLFETPSVAGLAAYMQRAESRPDPLGGLLPLRPGAQARPLFCIHPVVGLSWSYANLLRHLDDSLPLYGLQSRGLRAGGALPASIDEMAAGYLEQMRQIQPQGPYRLLGWSLGGLLAHAVAARLQVLGERVELLAMLDAFPFVTAHGPMIGQDEAGEARTILQFLGFHRQARENPPAGMDQLADLLCREYDIFGMPLVRELMKDDPQLVGRVAAATRHHLELARRHVPERIQADVMFFHATQREEAELDGVLQDRPAAWRSYVDGMLEVHAVPCHHQAMLDAAPAAQIGRLLQRRLDALAAAPVRTPAARQAPAVRERVAAHA